MKDGVIVESAVPVTLIGGGAGNPADVAFSRALAPVCVAADGGAMLALEAGVMPDAVIGDFDSLPEDIRARIPRNSFITFRNSPAPISTRHCAILRHLW